MNTIISFLLIFFFASSFLLGRTTLTPSQPSGNKGDVISIDLHFSTDTAQVVGAQFAIEYDPAQMTVGEIIKGEAVVDHAVFDEQTNGKITLTVLSMTNQIFTDGVLASVSFTLDEDLSSDTTAATLSLNETMLVTKAGGVEAFEAIQKINDLFLKYAAEVDSTKPSTSRAISFSSEDDGSDTSYSWDFGDGNVKSGKNASHTYKTPNSYLITITATNFLGSKESTRRVTIDAPYWLLDAKDLGNGWKSFDWFGNYYESSSNNWIYHEQLGWLYRSGETVDDTWFWSKHWNWGWTSDLSYPYLVKSNSEWMFYLQGTSNPIRLYDYGLSSWLDK
ncbi:MAG: PKD domain-containing protein [Opitutae bacterium]|jgi:hypothetical protein|nr:PKD domain-containing protein [Opitutae bacterium]